MSVCVPHPNFGCLIWHCALFRQNASRVYASGPGPWEVSPASSGMLRIVTPSMSMEEHISQLTAQVVALQAQLACCSWSPPPPQPSTAQPPPLKPPKVSAPLSILRGTRQPRPLQSQMLPLSQYQALQVPGQMHQHPVHLVIHEGRNCRPLGHPENQFHPLPSQCRRGNMGRVCIGAQ